MREVARREHAGCAMETDMQVIIAATGESDRSHRTVTGSRRRDDQALRTPMAVAIADSEESSAARKPLYEGSTQFKNWRYSPEQLQRTRESLNAAAVAAIRNAFEADSARPLVSSSPPIQLKPPLLSQARRRTYLS